MYASEKHLNMIKSVITFLLYFISRCKSLSETCSDTTIQGTGTSALNDLINYVSHDFGYNRSLFNRNSRLLYRDDTLVQSKLSVSANTSNPTSFASLLIPISEADMLRNEFQHLQSFPVITTSIVIVYNLPDTENITLSLDVISKIYQGIITTWNDTPIQAINPTLNLPSADIKVVVRRDETGATYALTSALSGADVEWDRKYGRFSDPGFLNNKCCNSSRWPKGAIDYYANDGTGLGGVITSIPYTIGYATLADAGRSDMRYAILLNSANQPVLPTAEAVTAAISYFSLVNTKSLVYDLNDAKLPNAYPIVTYIYFVVHMATHPQIDCCTMVETVAFFDWFLFKINRSIIYNYSFIPLPDMVSNQVKRMVIQGITCQGKSVYDDYLESLKPIIVSIQLWHIILIVISIIVLIAVVGSLSYSIILQQRRKAEETKWFIPLGKIKSNIMFEAFHFSPSGMTTSTSQSSGSTTSDPPNSSRNNVATQLKHVLEIGENDGEAVYLHPLRNFAYPLMWRRVTKRMMLKFTQEIMHKNVNRIIGVALWQDSVNLIVDFSFKGTLHYVLQTCRYDLNDVVKFSLAADVAAGMQFLTMKGVLHGNLSSVSCYLDGSWTVRVSEWGEQSLCVAEGIPRNDLQYSPMNPMEEIDFIRLLYKDYDINFGTNTMKNDVFSFGMLLLEIFSRKLPFHHEVENGSITFSRILEEKFMKHKNVKPAVDILNIPQKIVELIHQCCETISGRPTFTEINLALKKEKPSKNGIIDAMMNIIESHGNDLQRKTADLQCLTTRMEELLHDVLPPQIANKLFHGEIVPPEHFENVTICFADVVGFTTISAKSNPQEVMAFLNDLWIMFDGILQKYDAYKIDTIGDAYLVCSGLPQRNGFEHCKHIASLSLSLLDECENFKIFHLPNEKMTIRIGINSGPVTAGIVGSKMPQYCIFGDAVNVAARMQTTSIPTKIHVSEATYNLLQTHYDYFMFEKRGEVDVKGKGVMTTYWLLNENRQQISQNENF